MGGALILGYHRVADPPWDPLSLAVRPKHFAGQLEWIRKYAHPISLRELVDRVKDGKVPRRAIVITFDDGYADNLYAAKPLLERYDLPATIFVSTGYLGTHFWWDELATIVLSAKALPERFRISVNGNVCEWRPQRRFRGNEIRMKMDLLSWLQQLFQYLPQNDRPKAMKQVRALTTGATENCSNPTALSAEELLRLAKGNLLEIGAHTVSHPMLAQLSKAQQESEIVQSKRHLEDLLNNPVNSFSYPHGSFSETTVAAVRDAGYARACTSLNDIASSRSDCFQLPRFWVPDWDGDQFSRWTVQWLNG